MKLRAPRVFRWTEPMNTPEIQSPEFAEFPRTHLPADELPETIVGQAGERFEASPCGGEPVPIGFWVLQGGLDWDRGQSEPVGPTPEIAYPRKSFFSGPFLPPQGPNNRGIASVTLAAQAGGRELEPWGSPESVYGEENSAKKPTQLLSLWTRTR